MVLYWLFIRHWNALLRITCSHVKKVKSYLYFIWSLMYVIEETAMMGFYLYFTNSVLSLFPSLLVFDKWSSFFYKKISSFSNTINLLINVDMNLFDDLSHELLAILLDSLVAHRNCNSSSATIMAMFHYLIVFCCWIAETSLLSSLQFGPEDGWLSSFYSCLIKKVNRSNFNIS